MLKKMYLAAALALSLAAGSRAYAEEGNMPEGSRPAEVSQRLELSDDLALRIFSGNGWKLLAAGDGRTTQEHLGVDLELKLDGELSRMVPYVRGELNTVGYDLDLPVPAAEQGRDLAISGGAGMKFKLYEEKKMEITLDTYCGYDNIFGQHCKGGVGIRW